MKKHSRVYDYDNGDAWDACNDPIVMVERFVSLKDYERLQNAAKDFYDYARSEDETCFLCDTREGIALKRAIGKEIKRI